MHISAHQGREAPPGVLIEAVPPTEAGGVVMGAGVHHPAAAHSVGGEVGVVGRAIEGELEHLHARQRKAIPQGLHRRGDHPEVLRDQRQNPTRQEAPPAATAAAQQLQQQPSRRLDPYPRLGGPVAPRHTPEGLQGAEMVEAQQVEEIQLSVEPLQPPAEASQPMAPPAIHRRAPQLAGGGKVVGRHTALADQQAIGRHGEQPGPAPDIGTVMGDIKRQVTQQPHPPLAGTLPQGLPLLLELPLQ